MDHSRRRGYHRIPTTLYETRRLALNNRDDPLEKNTERQLARGKSKNPAPYIRSARGKGNRKMFADEKSPK